MASVFYNKDVGVSGLLRACTDPGAPSECSLSDDERWTHDWVEAAVQGESRTFSKDDVFLVSGGGRGITASCILDMCSGISGGKFILLGRTPLESVPDWLSADMDNDEIKKNIVGVMSSEGSQPTPKKIEAKFKNLISIREINHTLAAIKEAGGEALYCSVDIVDSEALKESVEPLLKEWGEVKGIIHGAGVLADNLIEKLSDEDFRRVYQPKVKGLENLLALASPEQLDLCVAFSSVAAAFGNAGQSLYAISNQILNDRVESIRNDFPNAQVYSLNWGPWDAGMVTPALKQRFTELGIRTIPVVEGTRIFNDFVFKQSANPRNVAIGDKITSPGKELYCTLQRSPNTEEVALAKEHVIADRPVIPAAWAIKWMLDSASCYLPAHQGLEIRELRVLNGIFPSENIDPYIVRLEDFKVEDKKASCAASILSQDESGNSRIHYSCSLTFLDIANLSDVAKVDLDVQTETPSDWQAYRQGFIQYGEAFNGVAKLIEISESKIVTVIEASESNGLFNPLAYDLATHGILIWLDQYHEIACLPSEAERYTQFASLPSDQPLVVTLEIDDFQPPSVSFRFVIRTESGQTLAEADGLKMTLTAQPETVPA